MRGCKAPGPMAYAAPTLTTHVGSGPSNAVFQRVGVLKHGTDVMVVCGPMFCDCSDASRVWFATAGGAITAVAMTAAAIALPTPSNIRFRMVRGFVLRLAFMMGSCRIGASQPAKSGLSQFP